MHSFERELQVGLHAVREASRVCRSVQHGIGPEAIEKKNKTPVTIADFASQAVVCRALKDAFPDDPIIGEEDSTELRGAEGAHHLPQIQNELAAVGHSTDPEAIYASIDCGNAKDYSPRFWTLDPIDGTKGFLRKEQYAVSLALAIDGELQVGLLACPNLPVVSGESSPLGVIFYAVKGQGAFAVPIDDPSAAPWRVRVSDVASPGRMRMCESVESGHSSHGDSAELSQRLGLGGAPQRLDSQAKYAVVARGDAEIYLRLPTKAGYREKIWDHGGGVIVVEEAGGTVTDAFGERLDFRHGSQLERNRGVVVSNGPLHETILRTMEDLGIRAKYD